MGSLAKSMIFAMEGLFRNVSEFDIGLERYRNTIYQLSQSRAASIERIRLITIMPVDGRINRDLLRLELNTAIEISDLLLPAIQALVTELD